MPPLYAEGSNAWRRLLEELLRTTHDESIFAWLETPINDGGHNGVAPLLSATPLSFLAATTSSGSHGGRRPLYTATNQGLLWDLEPRTALIYCTKLPGRRLMQDKLSVVFIPLAYISTDVSSAYILLVELSCGHYERALSAPELSPALLNATIFHRDSQLALLQAPVTIYVHMHASHSSVCTTAHDCAGLSDPDSVMREACQYFERVLQRAHTAELESSQPLSPATSAQPKDIDDWFELVRVPISNQS